MPVHRGKDIRGPFYQYGHQHKYYYTANDSKSREAAKKAAEKQGRAIHLPK
jgi:hypothetical protein